jgi:hypothetical protein
MRVVPQTTLYPTASVPSSLACGTWTLWGLKSRRANHVHDFLSRGTQSAFCLYDLFLFYPSIHHKLSYSNKKAYTFKQASKQAYKA